MVKFRLPETLEGWPWPRRINPHYEEVKAESAAWFRSFNAFSTKAQRAFDLCDFSLLASLAYPTLSKEHLRTSCDMMNLFFVFDEYTDIRGPDEVEQLANVVMDALRNPEKERPAGECVVGEVARQFWHLGVQTASKTSQTRFLEVFDRYTKAVVDQARDRSAARMRTIEEYFEIRRLTIGTDPSYVPIEFAMDLPAEVYHHPTITALSLDVTDIILIDNDLCSYNKEQAAGDDLHNIRGDLSGRVGELGPGERLLELRERALLWTGGSGYTAAPNGRAHAESCCIVDY
ncbi:terpene cyclase, partial [Gelatoporia subvermispora B]